jgi:hypothetical protein
MIEPIRMVRMFLCRRYRSVLTKSVRGIVSNSNRFPDQESARLRFVHLSKTQPLYEIHKALEERLDRLRNSHREIKPCQPVTAMGESLIFTMNIQTINLDNTSPWRQQDIPHES